MLFEIDVSVDASTWSSPAALPAAFASLGTSPLKEQIHLPTMLLCLGFLTTPVQASGTSLAEHWAWVRYLHAIDHSKLHLTLTQAFAGLDPHQKTILSDDFGVGIAMYWLTSKLGFTEVCDGAYFIKNLRHRAGATVPPKVNKRGPQKSPDYVCLDGGGKFHVVECKGTQSGTEYRDHQISHVNSGGNQAGGVAQKKTIAFPTSNAGERLVCGTFLGTQGGDEKSHMRVVDPDGEVLLSLNEQSVKAAFDPMIRSTVARNLVASGLPALASEFASPDGFVEFPFHGRLAHRTRRQRNEFVQQRTSASRREFEQAESRIVARADGSKWLDRQQHLGLVLPLVSNDRAYTSVRIRQSVAFEALERMVSGEHSQEMLGPDTDYWGQQVRGLTLMPQAQESDAEDQVHALLRNGKFSEVEIVLK